MRGRIIAFSLITVLSNAVYAGEIFRCVAANGDVMFTNISCPANSKVQHVASYTPVPDVPTPAYSKPSFAAATSRGVAQQAYQAGYEQAQAEAQSEPSSDEDDYADGWIPFYPARRSRFDDHHPHARKTMAVQAPHSRPMVFTPHR